MQWILHLTEHHQFAEYETKYASHFPDPESQWHLLGTDNKHSTHPRLYTII